MNHRLAVAEPDVTMRKQSQEEQYKVAQWQSRAALEPARLRPGGLSHEAMAQFRAAIRGNG